MNNLELLVKDIQESEEKIQKEFKLIEEIKKEFFGITSIENAPKEKEDIWDEYNYR